MNSLHQRIAELSPEKREIFLRRLKERGNDSAPAQKIPRRGQNAAAAPLSFSQQRLWFLDQLEPANPFYNVPIAVRLQGPLNVKALSAGFDEIVRRHESLRTTFSMVEGRPVQVVSPVRPLALPLIDLSEIPEHGREDFARRLTLEEVHRPFNLAEDQLIRVALLRLSTEEHVLALTMHHIVSDGWSKGVLVREMVTLYEAFSRGQLSPLPELPIQCADFAQWQRESLQGESLERGLQYWRGQLSDAPPRLEFPTDRPHPPVQRFRGARHGFALPQALGEELKTLCQREGVTMYMLLMGAWQALLSRYSGEQDISVGTPHAGRSRVETEGLIGFFVNTLVVRTQLSEDPTFREVLRRVRESALGAYAHQDVPFEMLVEAMQPERNLSHTPLFQVMFVLENNPLPAYTLSDLRLNLLDIDSGSSIFEMTLYMGEEPQGLTGALEYNTDLFEEETIARLLSHFHNLLAAVSSNPDLKLSHIPLLSQAEHAQLINSQLPTPAHCPPAHCLHQLFESQTERTPDSTALVFEDESLTYRELNERANRLAHHLKELGVGVESRVGVMMERSIEMVVSLLAVLKAGGAYVPLDPQYPQERLSFMLEDAGVVVLLTHEQQATELGTEGSYKVVNVDADSELVERQSSENRSSGATGQNLAYVIYTSGSTGTPKGVLAPHSGAVNRLQWMWENYPFESTEVAVQKTSLNFVDSVWEIWGPLLQGIRLVLIPDEVLKDKDRFIEALEAQGVTRIVLVPSLLDALLNDREEVQRRLHSIKVWITSGEELTMELLRRFRETMPGSQLLNLYGSSEVAADVTYCDTRLQSSDAARVSIGRPIANTQLYVLDEQRQPVPFGVTGELYVGGAGLARGYEGQPALTAERFIPNPFDADGGARMYRTGDLVRLATDATLSYVGRSDQQVKVRGHRIELGEVEAALRRHIAVKEVVVSAREDQPGEKRLVAYIVPHQAQPFSPDRLRSFAQEKLPEYMIPSFFITLDALPLLPNGKVDRRALPAPEAGRAGAGVEYVGPRTEVEEILAGVWSEVLGVERIGVDDNFFSLGGHSLLATQLLSRLRETFHIEVSLRTLFASPTVATLAASLEAQFSTNAGLQAPPVLPLKREGDAPLSFAQQRLWFIDQLESGSPVYNIPTAVRLHGPLDVAALQQSFTEIVRRHETLRTCFALVGSQPVQIVEAAEPVRLALFDLSESSAERRESEARRLAEAEAQRPFDLERGPLLRISLVRLTGMEHLLLVTMHHIVSDGWSMGVLVREAAALYDALSKGQPSPLPELPVQYADFAIWQRQWMKGEVLETQLNYWRKQLAGLRPLEMSTDHARVAVNSHRGAMREFTLNRETSLALVDLSRREGVTLFMTLLAAWQMLLHHYTKQEEIVVGTDVANRNRGETEGLIGFFVNQLVLRARVRDGESFRELLQQVREVTLGAYTHQDLPFDKLVEDLKPERRASRMPFFQVKLVLQNAPAAVPGMSELRLEQVEVQSGTAKYDLLLTLMETERGLNGVLEYSTELYEAVTVARLLDQFQKLLGAIVATPGASIKGLLEVVDEAERQHSIRAEKEFAEVRRKRLKNVRPKPIDGVAVEGELTI